MKVFFMLFIATTSFYVFGADPTGRYKTIVDKMKQFQAAHSDIAQLFSIGANDDGVDIYGLRISTTPQVVDPKKIGHVMVGTHHGNEGPAATFSVRFMELLLARYQSNELWQTTLADIEWSIIPVLNVSGYNANTRHEHGLDPNRDYPGPCISAPGGKLKSIQQIMNFLKIRIFSGNVTVHGYDGSFTYPWGMNVTDPTTLDNNLFQQIFSKAATHNGYQVGNSGQVVYPAEGCYEDYIYWKHGHWSLLLELRDGSTSDIEKTAKAIAAYYDLLDSSPSTKNQFNTTCAKQPLRDLRFE